MLKDRLKRILKTGNRNFWRNGYLSIATVGIIIVTLFVISFLLIVNLVGHHTLNVLEEKVDVSIYFRTDVPESKILNLKEDLERFDEIRKIEYVSREKALAGFRERHKDNLILLQSLEELEHNPLEATLNIKAKDISFYQAIVGFLEGPKYAQLISKINYEENRDMINKLSRVTETIRDFALILSILFAIIAVLVTFNTIRLTIYTYKQEVEIMRLVGASNWFIRWPFIIEGILYGLFGAIIGLAMLYLTISLVSAKLTNFLPGIDIQAVFISNLLLIIVLEIAAGIFLGVISSLIAIRRYLKT